MIEYIEYKDERISILLPKQLKQKKPIRFFRGNLLRGKPQTLMSVGIGPELDSISVKAFKEEIKNVNVDNRPSWDKIVRFGTCEFGKDGYEILNSIVQQDTQYPFHRWDLMYKVNGIYIEICIIGGGTLEEFETIARTIVNSLEILK